MDILEFTGKVGIKLVVNGSFSVKINGQPHTLSRGDFFIVTPLFVYEDFEESVDLRMEWVSVSLHSFFDQIKQFARISFFLFIFKHPVNQMSEDEMQHCVEHFETIRRQQRQAADMETPEPLRNIILHVAEHNTESLLLSVITGLLWRNREEIFSANAPCEFGELLVPQFLLSVNQNLHRERTVAFYAACANLSPTHFSTLIRQKTGHPPMHWITFITINNAKVLLRDNSLNIKQIAHRLGFPEQFTFRKYFKNATGMSPTEFRKSKF